MELFFLTAQKVLRAVSLGCAYALIGALLAGIVAILTFLGYIFFGALHGNWYGGIDTVRPVFFAALGVFQIGIIALPIIGFLYGVASEWSD